MAFQDTGWRALRPTDPQIRTSALHPLWSDIRRTSSRDTAPGSEISAEASPGPVPRVRVSFRTDGNDETVTSDATGPVSNVAATGQPTISGTAGYIAGTSGISDGNGLTSDVQLPVAACS